jgi:hypothetical protein
MKVTNWCKRIRIALLAGGTCAASSAYAIEIPLGDKNFEAYGVPAIGYAYSDEYRPTSAWIDDQNGAGFPAYYTEDDGVSAWLYDADYADATGRAAPRSGNQAMHGLHNYSSQVTGAVFEAKKTYVFSVWAQNDVVLNDANGLFMYIFNGNDPFSEANSLANLGGAFTAINKRQAGMTREQSAANWTRVKVAHYVEPGAPEIGDPVGVGFFARRDTAVDDAKLDVAPLIYLEVNTTTGDITIKNSSGGPVPIDYYQVTSAQSSLNPNNTFWNSLQDQVNRPGFEGGDGSGNGWEEFGGTSSKVIGESNPSGFGSVLHGAPGNIPLGDAFRLGFPQDLIFRYGVLLDEVELQGDFNGDNVVNAADYVAWRKTDNTPEGYQAFRQEFGMVGGPAGASTLVRGDVVYVSSGGGGAAPIPEPATVILVGLGLGVIAAQSRRRIQEN